MLRAVASISPASGAPVTTANFVFDETPSGAINSTTGSDGNNIFTLAYAPSPGTSLNLRNNAIGTETGLVQGVHYTLSGVTITFVITFYPIAGTSLLADYMKA
jgi:hypothetical protein